MDIKDGSKTLGGILDSLQEQRARRRRAIEGMMALVTISSSRVTGQPLKRSRAATEEEARESKRSKKQTDDHERTEVFNGRRQELENRKKLSNMRKDHGREEPTALTPRKERRKKEKTRGNEERQKKGTKPSSNQQRGKPTRRCWEHSVTPLTPRTAELMSPASVAPKQAVSWSNSLRVLKTKRS